MSPVVYDIRDGLNPSRLTVAMWCFSWLYGHHPGGPYEDFDKVTDELIERGFNTVRIDCFPLLVGRLPSESSSVTIPARPLTTWGYTHRDYEHKIAQELIEFMTVTKAKGLNVILSTWNFGSKDAPKEVLRQVDAQEYARRWERTLDILADRDLLSHVVYVDLDQEFPFFSPFAERIKALGHEEAGSRGGGPQNEMEAAGNAESGRGLAWNAKQIEFVRNHMESLLRRFQARYPGVRFTFSLTQYWREVRSMGLAWFDVLELHFFMGSNAGGRRFLNRIGFNQLVKDRGSRDYKEYQRRIDESLKAIRPMLLAEMHNKLAFAQEWGREIAVPVVNTESWGPWWHMDHPDLRWDWLREWCAECNLLAGEYGLWGTTPWNFCHPYWENWKDLSWYREVNGAFLRSRMRL